MAAKKLLKGALGVLALKTLFALRKRFQEQDYRRGYADGAIDAAGVFLELLQPAQPASQVVDHNDPPWGAADFK